MGDLLKKRVSGQRRKKKKTFGNIGQNAIYSADGNVIKSRSPKWKKNLIIAAGVIAFLMLVEYVPPMFYSEPSETDNGTLTTDESAIKDYQTYLKDNPDADFDGDGLTNEMENEHGTNVWKADSDGDGVNDYAELFITDTSPTKATTVLAKQVQANDESEGSSLETPYKIDDIIFWPDSYLYKALGSVVRTMYGYSFCYYNGWVKFPETVYAYRYSNGIHYELEHRENEDAWYIDSSDEIVLYSDELTFVHKLSMPLVGDIILTDDSWGRFLTKILPDNGAIITCSKIAYIDIEGRGETTYTLEIQCPIIDTDDTSRLGVNMNSLTDLSNVYELLNNGYCVAVSLYSSNYGEAIGIVYGYDDEGNLLVSDLNYEPAGKLYITEKASRQMDQYGEINNISWFEWYGLGFSSSSNGDRISFFTSTMDGIADVEDETELITESETDMESETVVQTELQTEQTESQTELQTEMQTQTSVATEEIQAETGVPETELQQTETTVQTETATEPQTEPARDTVITFGF